MRSAIVVGAGVLGASVADRLARSGWGVTLVERWTPGHARAGSGGETRLVRCAHGDDVWHARSAQRAWRLWRELDPALVIESGVAWLARRPDGWEAESERVLHRLGIAAERVDAAALFPSVRTDDLAFTLFEPEAGLVRAADATRALVRRAVAHGAVLVAARAAPDGAAVALDGGRRLEADRVVWACGAWLGPLFTGLVDLRITQQDVLFLGAPGAGWAAPGVPGWVDYDAAMYGTGEVDGRGVKVAPDGNGPAFDAEEGVRLPRPEHVAAARAYLAHRFPALAGAPLISSQTCQYELTADASFLCAPHPDHDGRVWLLGGGSGHAFKHGPALAERVEAWLDGTQPPEPAFALGERTGARGLRTAGALGS